ncbi:MAG: restriction endonuclease subunit S [Desulfobacterales bacterium]|nr:restriction endonuclease subunit S [Desulfobacterales bacterium]
MNSILPHHDPEIQYEPKEFNNHHPKYVYYYLQTLRLERFKSGASVPTLDRNQFSKISIVIPPYNEQTEIANHLSTIDQKITLHTSKKRKLEELFRTLLHQLMTAEIRVNDMDLSFLEALTS